MEPQFNILELPGAMKTGYLLTDIHFGKKSNSAIHNQDCIDYLSWFCEQFRNDPNADYVAFLGDWHENRTAIDVSTLDYSYRGAKMLNDLGVPVFFLIGNHDLGTRDSRSLYSTIPFHEFKNFTLVHKEPMVVDTIDGGCLFVPFLMEDEYPSLHQYTDVPVWMGHFEFKGFVLTGYNITLDYGPDIKMFNKQKDILSGHFHRRQQQKNVTYIGNTFPMDFGDANLFERGLTVYNHTDNTIKFVNWTACPKYIKCTLSDLLDGNQLLMNNSYVFVDVDIPVSYEELTAIETVYNTKYQLRELKLDESSKFVESLLGDSAEDEDDDTEGKSTDELIVDMLGQVDDTKFDSNLLITMYNNARIKNE